MKIRAQKMYFFAALVCSLLIVIFIILTYVFGIQVPAPLINFTFFVFIISIIGLII